MCAADVLPVSISAKSALVLFVHHGFPSPHALVRYVCGQFAEAANEWGHADGGGALEEPILERNNVGMGICILNRYGKVCILLS